MSLGVFELEPGTFRHHGHSSADISGISNHLALSGTLGQNQLYDIARSAWGVLKLEQGALLPELHSVSLRHDDMIC